MGGLASFELDDEKTPTAAFLMNCDLLDSAHADVFFQAMIKNRFGSDLLELASFARRMSCHQIEQNRISALRDMFDNKPGIPAAPRHVAGEFSEGPVVIHLVRRNLALENHFGVRRHVKVR